jgi:anaerobic selenocysteine-containing dehydrogenase
MTVQYLASTCPHDCPSTCSLEVEKLSPTEIGRVRGAAGNGYTSGVVCAKVARYRERVHHPDRLTQPLRRVGRKGVGIQSFEPIGWDEALDIVADKFREVAERDGAEAIWPYHYAGTMGLIMRDGLDRLRHAYGTSRQNSTICNTLADTGWNAGHGFKHGLDAREMADADMIVVWGCNPVTTQVNVMTHVSRARKERGAKLVVIDTYKTPTAKAADYYLLVRPGTDGALAAAVMHICFRDGHADRDYLEKFTDFPNELEKHLSDKTAEWAAAITGLTVQEIEDFAAHYGKTDRAFLRLGFGFTRSRNGAASLHAVSCLAAVTGKWQYKGGGALYSNSGIYPIDWSLISGLDVRDGSRRALDQSRIGAILTGDKQALGDGPLVNLLFIQNTNPMVVCPDLNKVHEGFQREDLFVCVHEQFMTETAQMADIVLPATTFLEHDDLYIAGGHSYLSVTRAIIEPVGESRSNHDVLCALAERLDLDHPGFKMTAWEMINETLKKSNLPDAETIWGKENWQDMVLPEEEMHFANGFGHADGKFRFKPDWKSIGPEFETMPEMPGYLANIDHADEEYPFRMVTAPARNFLNSSFTETKTSRKKEGRPTVKIHPDDCVALGVETGNMVRLGNKLGSIKIEVEQFDGLQRGVIIVECIWDNAAFEENIGINALVSADAAPPKGGAVFHDNAVWVRSEP